MTSHNYDDRPSMTNTDDEMSHAEMTSVADADWLAELRSRAEDSGRSMADLISEDDPTADRDTTDSHGDNSDNDDNGTDGDSTSLHDGIELDPETTITSPGGLEAIRSMINDSSRNDVAAAPPAPENREDSEDASPSAAPIIAREPSTRPVPDDPGELSTSATSPTPTAPGTREGGQRWVVPPRLAADESHHARPSDSRTTQAASVNRMPIIIAVAVGLLVGFLIALFVFVGNNGGSNQPSVDTGVGNTSGTVEETTP